MIVNTKSDASRIPQCRSCGAAVSVGHILCDACRVVALTVQSQQLCWIEDTLRLMLAQLVEIEESIPQDRKVVPLARNQEFNDAGWFEAWGGFNFRSPISQKGKSNDHENIAN